MKGSSAAQLKQGRVSIDVMPPKAVRIPEPDAELPASGDPNAPCRAIEGEVKLQTCWHLHIAIWQALPVVRRFEGLAASMSTTAACPADPNVPPSQ